MNSESNNNAKDIMHNNSKVYLNSDLLGHNFENENVIQRNDNKRSGISGGSGCSQEA